MVALSRTFAIPICVVRWQPIMYVYVVRVLITPNNLKVEVETLNVKLLHRRKDLRYWNLQDLNICGFWCCFCHPCISHCCHHRHMYRLSGAGVQSNEFEIIMQHPRLPQAKTTHLSYTLLAAYATSQLQEWTHNSTLISNNMLRANRSNVAM